MREKYSSYIRAFASTLLLLVLLTPVAHAANEEIQPPDVYQLVAVVSGEIERLRWVMGRPQIDQAMPEVKGVSPHEVYFQAVTLFEKINRLSFELTLVTENPPNIPPGAIRPRHVHAMVKAAQGRIRHIEYTLGVNLAAPEPRRDASKTPTDVFKAVVQANRQLNMLIDRRFSPSDVYRQVTVAISYADRILATMPRPPLPPQVSPPTPGKRPVDVYRRLVEAYEMIREIGSKLDHPTLELIQWTDEEESIHPGDVFDIASLMVSELAYIHQDIPEAKQPRKIIWERGKFPSDVYQRVGVLEDQLQEILKRLE